MPSPKNYSGGRSVLGGGGGLDPHPYARALPYPPHQKKARLYDPPIHVRDLRGNSLHIFEEAFTLEL